ncbi:hypothetical protein AVEN_258441-1 [Araneus ventricosus]|uniref:Uncharacterized protein n=1 Tax=Araneus ventricosus TaxID=182803 RepID=A0A4Y2DI51_ARAVE|nr:hypothetical protein AVEN_258441-1 [Araneus ventricosus]
MHSCFCANNAVRAPLRPPYDGPFLVIDRIDKFFKMQRDGEVKVVSVDRLKRAFMLSDALPVLASANDSSETLIEVDEPIPDIKESLSKRFWKPCRRQG